MSKNRMEQSLGGNLQRLKKYEKKLAEEIQELKRVEQGRPGLSFSFVIEGKTIKDLQTRNRQLTRSSGISGLEPLYRKGLIKILYRMNNMNDEQEWRRENEIPIDMVRKRCSEGGDHQKISSHLKLGQVGKRVIF